MQLISSCCAPNSNLFFWDKLLCKTHFSRLLSDWTCFLVITLLLPRETVPAQTVFFADVSVLCLSVHLSPHL